MEGAVHCLGAVVFVVLVALVVGLVIAASRRFREMEDAAK